MVKPSRKEDLRAKLMSDLAIITTKPEQYVSLTDFPRLEIIGLPGIYTNPGVWVSLYHLPLFSDVYFKSLTALGKYSN